jgi:hypothetical protein
MKTIYTSLPVYDRLEKQCFNRAKKGGYDEIVPVICPRHRLPSFEVYMDTIEEIKDIDIINTSGEDIDSIVLSLTNSTYDTYTVSGSTITCVNAAGDATGFLTGYFTEEKYNYYEVIVRLTYTSGEYPYIMLRDSGGVLHGSYYQLVNGLNTVYLHTTGVGNIDHFTIWNSDAASFSIQVLSIKYSTLNYFAKTMDAIEQNGFHGFPFLGSYDVVTESFATRKLTLEKTTAGVTAGYRFYDNYGGYTIGDKVFVYAYIVMTSGTAPKMALRSYPGGTIISNIVQLVNGANYIVLTATVTNATGVVSMYHNIGELANFNITLFSVSRTSWPTYFDHYYMQYNSEALGKLIPVGTYYLRLTTASGYVYYTDWFKIECIYSNLISLWTNSEYEAFTKSGTTITSAVNTVGNGTASSDSFNIIKDEKITVTFYLHYISGTLPTIRLFDESDVWGTYVSHNTVSGLNTIELTSTFTGLAGIMFVNTSNVSFYTSEILVNRSYSEKYLTINYSNTCDIGELLYHGGLLQTIWFESEPMECTFPEDEEGIKNGEGRFVRSFARQVKKYLVRTKEMPDFIVDVFNRMKLHDTIELIDLVGNRNDIYNLEVEHEWLWDDKYYAKLELTFDYDESVVIAGCCNNIT